ncbi:MAG: putative proteasome accessory factor, partial [Actinomycetota bacterium]
MSSASPIERVTSLLALLLERRTSLTLRQIADELSSMYPSGQAALRGAFERDKALLRDIGVPIETEVLGGDQAGETAYRIDRDRYELRGLELDDDERRALQVAVAATRSEAGQEGIWKLGGAVAQVPTVVANLPQLDALPMLRTAIGAHHSIGFTYRQVERVLDPYGLLLRRGFWYVMGHDHGHGERRTYRVDRIESDVSVDEESRFERPADFRPDLEFPDDPKQLGTDDVRFATVAVHGGIAEIVRRDLGADAVRSGPSDDPVVFEVPCSNVVAFRSWLLGLGLHAEVLAPADVRADVIGWLSRIAAPA